MRPTTRKRRNFAHSGDNPATFEFTAMYDASVLVGCSVFQSVIKYFDFQTRKATRGVVKIYNAGVVVG
jgi:hypothetical protein